MDMETGEDVSKRAAYVGVAVAVVAVSFSSILIRWSEANFMAIAAGRMLLSAAMLAPFALLMYRKELFALDRKDAAIMVGIGAVLATHFSLWIASLASSNDTSVASSVVLVTSHPVLVGLVGHFLMNERLSRLNAMGIIVGLAGVTILAWGDASSGRETLIGDLMALLGGVAAGVYILGGRRTRKRISLVVYAFVVYTSCAAFLLVAVIVTGTELFGLGGREWGLFALMALGPSILGHTVYNWTLRHVPASVVSVSLLGEPIGSSILAFALLSESPPELAIVGGGVILAGILLATWNRKRAAQPEPG
jgi:drug/metabolite transporter (DMT)-like permease